MGFKEYIIRRIIYSVAVLFIVIVLNYAIFMLMPGDPIEIMASESFLKPEKVRRLYELYGLDKPPHIRFLLYIKNMLTWEFGYSYAPGSPPVIGEMMKRLPNTLLLMLTSTVLSILLAIVLGVLAAAKRGGIIDSVAVTSSLFLNALPSFWIGLMILLVFGYYLGWIPLGGTVSRPPPTDPIQQVIDIMWHLVGPLVTLTLIGFGGLALILRNTLLDVFTEDYILTARAKGLSERTILFKHGLRNAMLPLITVIALSFGFILSGAVITETVFSWYGLGRWVFEAVMRRDYPVLQAMFYFIALCVIIANFIADILYGFLDPRVKTGA